MSLMGVSQLEQVEAKIPGEIDHYFMTPSNPRRYRTNSEKGVA